MSVDNQTRIECEEQLLQAIATNDGTLASEALEKPEVAQLLLTMQVKDTYKVEDDAGAFYHSVASFGLTWGLLDTAKALAQRNQAQAVLEVIANIETGAGDIVVGELDGAAVQFRTAEAAMLAALNEDDARGLLQVLEGPHGKQLLQLQVKETLGDADDTQAFFHSVASYGLNFAFGDLPDQLAQRNAKPSCTRTFRTFRRQLATTEGREEEEVAMASSGVPVKIIVTNALTGDFMAELAGSSEWRTYDVIGALEKASPSQGGCRTLILGDTPLEAGATIASLLDQAALSGSSDHQLEVSVVSSQKDPRGNYHAKLPARNDPLDFPGPLPGRGRRRDPTISLTLGSRNKADLELSAPPIDRGHCAGSSGGCRIAATGTWAFSSPGIVVTLTRANSYTMQRGHWWPLQRDAGSEIEGIHEVKLFFHDVGKLSVAESFFIGKRVRGGMGCTRGTLIELGQTREFGRLGRG